MNAFGDEGFGDIPFGASDEKEVLREGSALDDSSFMHSKDNSKLLLEESHSKDPSNALLERSKLSKSVLYALQHKIDLLHKLVLVHCCKICI